MLLVDLDPQASATKVLGVDAEERCSMADVMLEPDRYTLSGAVIETQWGLDAVASETALASREARRPTADEFVLREQLARVNGYDVVLVDCPPSLGLLTLNALAAASHLVVVTEPVAGVASDGSLAASYPTPAARRTGFGPAASTARTSPPRTCAAS